jgi:UDPglucose 6-dehydrogenase
MRYVQGAVESLLDVLSPGDLVVGKSTVPVGTADALAEMIADKVPGALLVCNPEFLREGFAVEDTLHPDRLVNGLPAGPDGDTARALLDEIFATIVARGTPKVERLRHRGDGEDRVELVPGHEDLFHQRDGELCEVTGADVKLLADAIGYDDRIGRKFLNAGLGFGGGCLPKDIRAFMARAGGEALRAPRRRLCGRGPSVPTMPWSRIGSPLERRSRSLTTARKRRSYWPRDSGGQLCSNDGSYTFKGRASPNP